MTKERNGNCSQTQFCPQAFLLLPVCPFTLGLNCFLQKFENEREGRERERECGVE